MASTAMGASPALPGPIEAIAAAATRRANPVAGVDPAAFVRAYYAGVDPDDLAGRDADEAATAALAHLALGAHRGAGTAVVRAYTPAGPAATCSVLDVVTDDMAFLVDSAVMALNARGYGIRLVVHPVLWARRRPDGVLDGFDAGPAPSAAAEAWIHVELDVEADAELLDALTPAVVAVLGDVRAAVEDWPAMRRLALHTAIDLAAGLDGPTADDAAEARALLEWMTDDHFTFLGARDDDLVTGDGGGSLRPVPGSALGLLRDEAHAAALVVDDIGASGPGVDPAAALVVTRSDARSTVHRPVRLAHIGVRRHGPGGGVIGARRFVGLWTATAYTESPFTIPLLRRKARRLVERAGFAPDSHSARDLTAIVETFPRDELFEISDDDLARIAIGILHLAERPQVRLFTRVDTLGRYVSCLVFVPRDHFTTALVRRIEAILLDATDGLAVEHTLRVTEGPVARIHAIVEVDPRRRVRLDEDALERRLAAATRSWSDDLRDALVARHGDAEGRRRYRRWRTAFGPGYTDETDAATAVADIESFEALPPSDGLALTLALPTDPDDPSDARLRVHRSGAPIALSGILPALEHMGVEVVDERPHEVNSGAGPTLWLYDLGLRAPHGVRTDDPGLRARFTDAVGAVWAGDAESDGFNRLVASAGLAWREVAVLRAVGRYLRQGATAFSLAYMEQAVANQPAIARRIVERFTRRFDPQAQEGADVACAALDAEVDLALDEVASLDEDRILRAFHAAVRAVVRTNYFKAPRPGTPPAALALKFDPSRAPDLPAPRPWAEVWVYSPRVEAVHLRGGPVARGGIRWSDRREDFRTEVLGLMRTQMVKNAVIVPVGAKGGFVVKRPPEGRDALAAEVEACYRAFIGALLDVTDDLDGTGAVTAPASVVRLDGDDPYLVVAADKGTATFSDTANGIATDRGYWLGDAFASGGSSGYDHKAMGITARGAWESVRRHFRALGRDADHDRLTVAGIGDMSGDVFGNGMLLSPRIALVAAFDHRHVFIDPDPDPAAAWAERRRLFGLPRSSWADYATHLISAGGGVWPRTAKSIPLSAQARAVLGVDDEHLTPAELIRAVLRAPVDLLWNGGIGTYVKATAEAHADAGDRANDPVRVDAAELRCRAVAEGGNLGLTQRARVELAQRGVLVNTDAIDNSAGVDCSDHEVNIKVALGAAVAAGELDRAGRDALLAAMADEVAELVLDDNRLQTRALTIARAQAVPMADVHARYLRSLEHDGDLDRALERLPDDTEMAARESAAQGLTVPELAVLLAYTKTTDTAAVLASDLPDDPALEPWLLSYFPAAMRDRFPHRILGHRLRREIVATRVVNAMVNVAGTSFDFRMSEETGSRVPDIVRAHLVSRAVFDIDRRWARIDALDADPGTDPDLTVRLLLDLRSLCERGALWLLRHRRPPIDIDATVAAFAGGAAELGVALASVVAGLERAAFENKVEALVGVGLDEGLALDCAALGHLAVTFDVVEVARSRGRTVAEAASVHFAVAERLGLDWFRGRISALPRRDRWQSLARAALRDDLQAALRNLTAEVLRAAPMGAVDPGELLEDWVGHNRAGVERCLAVFADIRAGGVADLATLSVGLRELRNLLVTSSSPIAR